MAAAAMRSPLPTEVEGSGRLKSEDWLPERSQFELSGDLGLPFSWGRTLKAIQLETLRRFFGSVLRLRDWMYARNRAMCGCHPIGAGDYEETFKDTETGAKPRKTAGTTQAAQARGAAEAMADSVRLRSSATGIPHLQPFSQLMPGILSGFGSQ